MTLLVKLVFLIVGWTFWGILGTLFWCALVFRALVVFSAAFLYAMFTEQNPSPIELHVEHLTDLWFRGFRNVYQSLFGKMQHTPMEVRNTRLFLEVFWACAFWYALLLIWMPSRAIPAYSAFSRELSNFLSGISFGWNLVAAIIVFFIALIIGYKIGVNNTPEADEASEIKSQIKDLADAKKNILKNLENKNNLISERTKILADKDALIAEKDKIINEKNIAYDEVKSQVSKQEAQLHQISVEIKTANKELEEVRSDIQKAEVRLKAKLNKLKKDAGIE
ncbi:MAG TPA: hypothetical protein PKE26_15945 [Kiritimatiellia bacterium]|nr:hypothetical protein [Kiritimatiellia bacterium]HMP00589.1 hypothetical protein [Kiritimatiellia bacterium]